MSAQVQVAFKVSEGGLRNAALHPGSSRDIDLLETDQKKKKKTESSCNPLVEVEEVQIRRTPLRRGPDRSPSSSWSSVFSIPVLFL